jgi:hypothetical protein
MSKRFSVLPNFVSAQLRVFSAQLRVTIIYFAEVRGEDAELRGEIPIFFYPQICTDLHRLILRKSVQFCGQITHVKRSINAHFSLCGYRLTPRCAALTRVIHVSRLRRVNDNEENINF